MAQFAAMGTSGLSLGLGIYNTTQIASLKEQVDKFSKITDPDFSAGGISSSSVSDVVVAPIAPLVVSTPVTSESPEVAELQTRLNDVETYANVVGTRSTSNLSKVTIAGDDIDRLETHVTSEFVDIRSAAAQSGNEIATNNASIGMLEISLGDTNSDIQVAVDTANQLASSVSDISSTVDTTVARVGTLESNQQTIASGLTAVTLEADQLGDNIALVDGLGQDTKNNLESLTGSWNTFNATAFVGDGILNVADLNASSCRIGLIKNKGTESAIHFNSLQSNNWSMYFSNNTGVAPDGKTPASLGNVRGYAIRMKMDTNTQNGFIIEDGNSSPVYSISSEGVSKQLGSSQVSNCSIGEVEDWAIFSNSSRFNGANFAIAQHSTGATTVNCGNSKSLSLAVNGTTKAYVSKSTSLTIKNKNDEIWSTIFNHQDGGNNYYRATSAHRFQFNKTSSGETSITSDEVTIGGKAMKSSLEALEARVAILEGKINVEVGQTVYLQNTDSFKFLSKATNDDDAVINRGSREARSGFKILE